MEENFNNWVTGYFNSMVGDERKTFLNFLKKLSKSQFAQELQDSLLELTVNFYRDTKSSDIGLIEKKEWSEKMTDLLKAFFKEELEAM